MIATFSVLRWKKKFQRVLPKCESKQHNKRKQTVSLRGLWHTDCIEMKHKHRKQRGKRKKGGKMARPCFNAGPSVSIMTQGQCPTACTERPKCSPSCSVSLSPLLFLLLLLLTETWYMSLDKSRRGLGALTKWAESGLGHGAAIHTQTESWILGVWDC